MVRITTGRALLGLLLFFGLGVPVGMAFGHLMWVQALIWFLLAISVVTGFSGFVLMIARDSSKQDRRQGQIIALVSVAYAALCVGYAIGSSF